MTPFHRYILFLALIVYTITAWYSVGHYHPDEYYQIIEFARLKQGLTMPVNMAWEYKAQIRPTLQPVLCYGIFTLLDLFSTDSYLSAFVLRLISACVMLYAITQFVKAYLFYFQGHFRTVFIVLSYFFFLLPVISVRFSSETWSAVFMLLSIAWIQSGRAEDKKGVFVLGMWLGLAFLFRFQSLFFSAGLFFWMVFIRKSSRSLLIGMCTGILLIVILGFALDSWFYGQPVVTFWNYFDYNLLRGVANKFGVAPWYDYFKFIFYFFGRTSAALLLLAVLFYIVKAYKQPLVWALLPFLFIHCLIAHKEIRFLFPLVCFIPFIFIYAIQNIDVLIPSRFKNKIYQIVLVSFLVVYATMNTLALIVTSLIPVNHGIAGASYIHKYYRDERITFLCCDYEYPYALGRNLSAGLYKEKYLSGIMIDTITEIPEMNLPKDETVFLLIRNKYETESSTDIYLKDMGWEKEMQSIPQFIKWFRLKYRIYHKSEEGIFLYRKVRS